ncbi:hypothetical protein [uncultured Desulfuromusa sp.]|uniref:hypothetical protein n=1 Tax=uncultured Desulfuromusa sp. TaxID=219183 RepID=UPI002AA94AA6|nr:hypothetical protein [uncultured Desulfuromusa sp.]
MAKDTSLIYLTGLSIDKKSMNDTYRYVNGDPRYSAFQKIIEEELQKLSGPQSIYELLEGLSEHKTLLRIADLFGVSSQYIIEFSGRMLGDIGTLIAEGVTLLDGESFRSLTIKYQLLIEKRAVKAAGANKDDEFFASAIMALILKTLISVQENKSKSLSSKTAFDLTSLDCFNLFTSHQSDCRGLIPLVSVVEQLSKKGGVGWLFSDYPYYKNMFLRGVNIKIDCKKLKKRVNAVEKNIRGAFLHHYLLANLSNYLNNKDKKKIFEGITEAKYIKGKLDLLGKISQDRNLFGVALLSDILYRLRELKGDQLQIKVESRNPENSDEIIDKDNFNFVTELLLISGCPSETRLTGVNEDFDVSVECSIQEDFKNNFAGFFIADADSHSLNIHIPVNLVLSVPLQLNKEKKGFNCNYKLLFPKEIYGNPPMDSVIDVLSVGGVEHNRPLLRLLNAARYQGRFLEKSKKFKSFATYYPRTIGFTDNRFDFEWYLHQKSIDSSRTPVLLNINNFVGLASSQIIKNYRNYWNLVDEKGNKSYEEYEQDLNKEHALVISTMLFLGDQLDFNWHDPEKLSLDKSKYRLNVRSLIGLSARASSFAMLSEALSLNDKKDAMNVPSAQLFKYEPKPAIKSWGSDLENKLYEITGGINPYLFIMNAFSPDGESVKLSRMGKLLTDHH